ncbi:anti-sigma factor [Arthrobacter sp. CG_A4]|uniref:anti-sigma factor n=1 Tax=Arthrobacter sp. CG_A4 TaxID=3071706 RepID=UPI002E032162|nr:hypothetical protein [Arthrobacter sp. CG_A4]
MGLLARWRQGRHKPQHRHLEFCTECLLQQRRERQYLERLRGAGIPSASHDLTARLLARTEKLASEQPAAAAPPRRPGPQRGRRLAALVAGSAAAAATLMAGSAYLLGGDAPPLAAGVTSSAFLQKDLPSGEGTSAGAGAGAASRLSVAGEPGITPAGALTPAQLNRLRSQGWTCPDLGELGYHLVWARGGVVAGGEVLELRLTDGQHFATVMEQHGGPDVLPLPSGTRPVNVLTGRPAPADGFTSVHDGLWVNPAAPFRAILQTSAATFTYISDQPAEQADDGVAALMRAGSVGAAADPASGTPAVGAGESHAGGLKARMERGLGRILEFLAP